jgi:hypothetical protein
VEEGARKEWLVASEEPSAKITLGTVNFLAADVVTSDFPSLNYTILAHVAAAALAERAVHTLVWNAVDIPALDDEATFPTPVGSGSPQFVVVGKEAFDLLPERMQQFVFDPPQPEKSNYFGAVGSKRKIFEEITALQDTEDKLTGILNMMVFRGGDGFKERMRVFNRSVPTGEDFL